MYGRPINRGALREIIVCLFLQGVGCRCAFRDEGRETSSGCKHRESRSCVIGEGMMVQCVWDRKYIPAHGGAYR
ncbi:hypothetical protein C8R45DRAFT_966428 [Mycena sanguinolenta]|nr:hypothetical protein C8R45DRAFT_966428 [Mycena sanguinolenta]